MDGYIEGLEGDTPLFQAPLRNQMLLFGVNDDMFDIRLNIHGVSGLLAKVTIGRDDQVWLSPCHKRANFVYQQVGGKSVLVNEPIVLNDQDEFHIKDCHFRYVAAEKENRRPVASTPVRKRLARRTKSTPLKGKKATSTNNNAKGKNEPGSSSSTEKPSQSVTQLLQQLASALPPEYLQSVIAQFLSTQGASPALSAADYAWEPLLSNPASNTTEQPQAILFHEKNNNNNNNGEVLMLLPIGKFVPPATTIPKEPSSSYPPKGPFSSLPPVEEEVVVVVDEEEKEEEKEEERIVPNIRSNNPILDREAEYDGYSSDPLASSDLEPEEEEPEHHHKKTSEALPPLQAQEQEPEHEGEEMAAECAVVDLTNESQEEGTATKATAEATAEKEEEEFAASVTAAAAATPTTTPRRRFAVRRAKRTKTPQRTPLRSKLSSSQE
ncbi:antigen identified by monoclonal antibody Ki-67 [Balamuthia mandrillaris]